MSKKALETAQEITPETVAETTQDVTDLPLEEVEETCTVAEVEIWKETALRAQADLVNLRNRSAREREQFWSEARADTVAQFLPVLDNIERAIGAPCADEAYKQGVELTLRQFIEILTKLNVSEIPALHQPFDPQTMDAVMHEESEEHGENTVAQVFSKGYRMGDRVLRHAMVKVVN